MRLTELEEEESKEIAEDACFEDKMHFGLRPLCAYELGGNTAS
jgi:ferritin-like protein